jgi:hypothetical protein
VINLTAVHHIMPTQAHVEPRILPGELLCRLSKEAVYPRCKHCPIAAARSADGRFDLAHCNGAQAVAHAVLGSCATAHGRCTTRPHTMTPPMIFRSGHRSAAIPPARFPSAPP